MDCLNRSDWPMKTCIKAFLSFFFTSLFHLTSPPPPPPPLQTLLCAHDLSHSHFLSLSNSFTLSQRAWNVEKGRFSKDTGGETRHKTRLQVNYKAVTLQDITDTDVHTGTENLAVNPLCYSSMPFSVKKLISCSTYIFIFLCSSLTFTLIFMTQCELIADCFTSNMIFCYNPALQLGAGVLTARRLCGDSRGSIRLDETLMIPVGNQAIAASKRRQYTSKKNRMQRRRQPEGCMQTSS